MASCNLRSHSSEGISILSDGQSDPVPSSSGMVSKMASVGERVRREASRVKQQVSDFSYFCPRFHVLTKVLFVGRKKGFVPVYISHNFLFWKLLSILFGFLITFFEPETN
jgi:hypothetical protein